MTTEQGRNLHPITSPLCICTVLAQGRRTTTKHNTMKKLIALFAFAGILGAASAQTTTVTPDKEKAAKVAKTSCSKGEAKAGKSCCAGKADAKAAAAEAPTTTAVAGEAKTGCCAGKATAAKSCHGDGAKAEAGHAHDHAEAREHACTEACKEGAHALACGEKGHACTAECHAHKH